MAEVVGFEPTVPFNTPHFKCGTLNHSDTLPYLVRPAGFEPTTPWFEAKYSIQLS